MDFPESMCRSWNHRSLPVHLLAICLLAFCVSVTAAAGAAVEVEQGGVARWDGEDLTSCGMDGRTYKPVDGTCWYPVDFARQPATIEIARWTKTGLDTAWLRIVEREFETQDIEFPDDRYVNLSDEDLERHYGEQARLKPRLNRGWNQPARFSIPLAKPTSPLPEGGGFGAYRNFNGESKSRHTGTDYAIALGTPIAAPADGTVVMAEEHFFAGLGVYVDHGAGLFSMQFHLQKATVEEGADVERGATVGEIGSTGRSTGPHLHLGLRWRGARIDPAWLLDRVSEIPSVP